MKSTKQKMVIQEEMSSRPASVLQNSKSNSQMEFQEKGSNHSDDDDGLDDEIDRMGKSIITVE